MHCPHSKASYRMRRNTNRFVRCIGCPNCPRTVISSTCLQYCSDCAACHLPVLGVILELFAISCPRWSKDPVQRCGGRILARESSVITSSKRAKCLKRDETLIFGKFLISLVISASTSGHTYNNCVRDNNLPLVQEQTIHEFGASLSLISHPLSHMLQALL